MRRTSTLDVAGGRDLAGPLVLRGSARDIVTDLSGIGRERGAAEIEVEIDRSGRRPTVSRLDLHPASFGAEALIGATVPGGFRAALAGAAGPEVAASSPLHLLLDDVPGAVIVSGYARAVEPPDTGGGAGGRAGGRAGGMPPADVCSGWRSDGTMMIALRRHGTLPPLSGPPAPSLGDADPSAWHPARPLPPREVRRRRRMDVTASGGVLLVDAMFRDSYVDSDGDATVVHEYQMTARVEAASGEILAVEAVPRVLPWGECPAASGSAAGLVGTDVRGVRRRVSGTFTGVGTCTHLNDLLRSLGDVATLADLLAG